MHTKNKLMKNKENKMWKALSVAWNAPEDKNTEIYVNKFYVNYLMNKVILVEFPLGELNRMTVMVPSSYFTPPRARSNSTIYPKLQLEEEWSYS